MYPESEDLPESHPATLLVHDPEQPLGAVVPPIVQTSLFTFPDYDSMAERFRGEGQRAIYSRVDNPTVRAFEAKLAALEHAQVARAFASGMGAISGAMLAFAGAGDRVVAVRHVYPDAYRLMTGLLPRLGIEVTFVDGADALAVEAALPGASILYLESPTSWTFEVHDIGRLAGLARPAGAVSMIDNSWASTIFQRPLDHGVDLVLHSASKYISGHSDVVAGVVAGSREKIARIDERVLPYLGAKLAPLDAWLLIRGLRTLPLRMERVGLSARDLARRLAEHPRVARVHHPALAGPAPGGALIGHSGLFAIQLAEGLDVRRFCDALRLFRLGVSWGGHESLACPAAVGLQQAGGANSLRDFGVSPQAVRLSIGLEEPADLWKDLEGALEAAAG
jgi:cystathionine beta-lyase/cystathionine gamma-synthase